MKKKLAILIYSLASGGAERVVSILLNELDKKYDLTLILMNDTIFYNITENIEIIYIENSDPVESGIKKLIKLPYLAWKYKKICQKYEIDFSLSFMNRPNYINTLSKVFGSRAKILISERIAPSQEYLTNSLKDKVSRRLIKYLYPKASVIIPNSCGIKIDLMENFNIDNNIIKVINNPIDLDKIKLLQSQHVIIKKDNFNFITIGRLFEQKNHDLLLESILECDANLYIIGEGELRNKLEEKIIKFKLEDRVFLLGRKENPYAYLKEADCFIFSSNYEGFPNVLLEALACGLPIISTDCISGPREILSPSTDVHFQTKSGIELSEYGILTPVGNKESLVDAIQLIISNQNLVNKYKKIAKKRASNFDKDIIINKFIEVIEN